MRRRHSQGPRREPIPETTPRAVGPRLLTRMTPVVVSADGGQFSAAPADVPDTEAAGESEPSSASPAGARGRSVRRLIAVFLLILLIAGGMVAMAMASLMREEPGWWRVMPPLAVTEVTGNRVQNELTTLITSTRPLGEDGHSVPWGMAINSEQANAWLNTKLRDWVRSRGIANEEYEPRLPEEEGAGNASRKAAPEAWIDQIREVQVDFNGRRIAIGVRILHDGSERVFSATLVPQVREDGSLWMLAEHVQIGRLSVPASWVLPGPAEASQAGKAQVLAVSQQDDVDLTRLPEVQVMFDAFSGRQPMLERPLLRLPDGRRVRLLSLTTRDDGMLIVTCRTEKP